jgi:hypothetical protein
MVEALFSGPLQWKCLKEEEEVTIARDVFTERRIMTRISWDPHFLLSDTLFHVFKHIPIFGRVSLLDDKGQSIFIFEQ